MLAVETTSSADHRPVVLVVGRCLQEVLSACHSAKCLCDGNAAWRPWNPPNLLPAADEIGDYITKSEKHLAVMRRQAEADKDKETLASLDSIDRNLAEAKRNHATLCSCCMEDSIDAKAAMTCCQSIDDALGKAISEHDTLMKRLGEKTPRKK